MQIKLALATVLTLAASSLAILPPNPSYHTRPIWSRPQQPGQIRPAVCSSNPHSALYCGPKYGGYTDKRSNLAGPPYGRPNSNIIRPAVCSSNPNSALYCPGVTSGYDKRYVPEPDILRTLRPSQPGRIRPAVCSSNPNSDLYCGPQYTGYNKRSDQASSPYGRPNTKIIRPKLPLPCIGCEITPPFFRHFIPGEQQKRSTPILTEAEREARRQRASAALSRLSLCSGTLEACGHKPFRPDYGFKAAAKRGINPAPVHRIKMNNGQYWNYSPTWAGAPGMDKRAYGQRMEKKPRMMVCSFDKKNPNYCPGMEKDTRKVDERKRTSFFG
ncbi:hypothetical protein BJ508DRAFT_2623 [Ascobolus immersus RN42]|uniref:Uncharacterized protein n=1 Tax=Ascobolus immersus RN42 TaxID=1160509 RepID=A0A3N4IQA2_ASCIM|nr:hypothetical protein BJ508DRAFT_2623 [Ascobolus immersus RN42]